MIFLERLEIDNVAAYRKANPAIRILHWVAANESQLFPVVIYDRLLLTNDQVNPTSKIVYTHTLSRKLEETHTFKLDVVPS